MMKWLAWIVMGALSWETGQAQTFPQDTTASEAGIDRENILESLTSYSDDISGLFEKIDLNTASSEDLLAIPGMSTAFASSIVEYRNKVKVIHNIDELSTLEGATPQLLTLLKDQAQISQTEPAAPGATGLAGSHGQVSSYASFSPQKASLYQHAYHDSGIRNFQKLRVDSRDFEFDAVSDKDPGEDNYLDFCSLAASARNVLAFSTIDVGDYTISLGNGMLFSNPGTISKSAGPITPLFSRDAYSLKPYRSLSENGFLQGAAFEIPISDLGLMSSSLEFTGFASSKNLNAHLNSSGFVTSIDYSGLDLSTGSSSANLSEKIVGGILRFDSPDIDCGASAVHFSYGQPFANYYFQQCLAEDIFVRSQSEEAAFAGEMLVDKVVSFSANVRLDPFGTKLDYETAQFAVGVRDFRSRIFQNYSGAMSESFPAAPEQGIYFGATFRPDEIIKLGFYYDRFVLMSTTGSPDRNGEEIFADSYINLDRERIFDGTATVIYFRYRYKTKEDFYVPEAEFPSAQSTLAGAKQNFRIDLRHNFSSAFSIRARFEKNFLSTGETGQLFLFDAASSTKNVTVNSRLCFYSTASYSSAFYEVEEDLPGMGQYSLLYGDGARVMVLTNVKITQWFSAGVKVSRDLYSEMKEITIGSNKCMLPGATYMSIEMNCKFN